MTNPNWLQDHQDQVERARTATEGELDPASDAVRNVMDQMARGQHRDVVEALVGDMLSRTPEQLFKSDPSARQVVYRAAAEQMIDPRSRMADAALDQMEGRYLRGFDFKSPYSHAPVGRPNAQRLAKPPSHPEGDRAPTARQVPADENELRPARGGTTDDHRPPPTGERSRATPTSVQRPGPAR